MRRLKTYPALGSIALPRSAVVLDVLPRSFPEMSQAPALVVSIDDADEETEQRRFVVLSPGDPIPTGAQFVRAWRDKPENLAQKYGRIVCLFEIADDLPADLPPEGVEHYRRLVGDGFALRPTDRAWIAPADVPPGALSHEQFVAVATLQEYGYGSVVNA